MKTAELGELEKDRDRKKGFISGALVLSFSTLLVKIIGLAVKIPMLSLLGAQGMGYFNSAYEIYALLCTVATAGLPIALSMLISQAREQGNAAQLKRTYRVSLWIFFGFGALGTLAMALFADGIAAYIENADAYYSILAIAPSLLFVCVASALRGYFQGFCNMLPTALSQLIEAIAKLLLGVLFVMRAKEMGCSLPVCAAAAVLGISIGTLLSVMYLYITKRIRAHRMLLADKCRARALSFSATAKNLISIAFPITLGALVIGMTRIIDMTLIMKRLQDIGYSREYANEIFGSYTTLAVPVFSLLPSLIAPISLSLVPQISAAIERGDGGTQSYVLSSSMRLTVLFAMPASFGVACYAPQILSLLFANEAHSVSLAAPQLSFLGPSILFSCIITTSNAMLQSYRKTSKPIISMAAGTAVKLVFGVLLIGDARVGALGAPLSTLLCNITITAMNVYYLNKYLPRTEGVWKIFGKPFLCSVAMMLASLSAFRLVLVSGEGEKVAFFAALTVAVVAYLALSLVSGALSREDIMMLPAGERIINKFGKKQKTNKF